MKEEIWQPIKDYEGLYEISNLGNVKSLNYKRTGEEQIMKYRKNESGYLTIQLFKNGKKKNCKVHRLVAQAFLLNPNNYPEVNHKNEIKTDNIVENLEWCTRQYNLNYGSHNERMAKSRSIPIVQLTKTGEYIATYQSAKYLKRNFNYDDNHIGECCKGKLKTSNGYKWMYLSEWEKRKAV